MDQRNDLVGEAAVDLLVSMIHNGQHGVPEQPIATLVASQWVTGSTVQTNNTPESKPPVGAALPV